MWITPILRPQGPFRLDNMPMHPPLWMHGHYRYPDGQAQQASRNRIAVRATAARTWHARNTWKERARAERSQRTCCSRDIRNNLNIRDFPAAETSTAIATTEQSPEPAKPTLRDLAGVKPSDKPTEQDRPKRDRPRLVFQPIHAVIAILTLSCALCASLTMLIQQAVHYSALQQSQITQSEQSKANGTEKDKTASTQTTPSQQPSTEPDSQSEPTSGPAEPADPADGLLNINTAGSDELQTLKGVGPVTAQRIIDYRNQIGRFDNVDQLLEVKGIGEKTLAKFRDQVCAR